MGREGSNCIHLYKEKKIEKKIVFPSKIHIFKCIFYGHGGGEYPNRSPLNTPLGSGCLLQVLCRRVSVIAKRLSKYFKIFLKTDSERF